MIRQGQLRKWDYTVYREGSKNFLIVSQYVDDTFENAMQTKLWNVISAQGESQTIGEDFIERYSLEIKDE